MIINIIKQIIYNPTYAIELLMKNMIVGKILSDEMVISYMYKKRFSRNINLKDPKTFNEKILLLSLVDRKDKYTIMADKYNAKFYIDSIIGSGYTPKNYGIWENTKSINFECLPKQYVLKCNHDSGSVIICNNRKPSTEELRKIDKHLKYNYFYFSREWPYKNIKPRVFAEEYIASPTDNNGGLVDYKFYCFNGDPKYVLVISYRSIGGRETFFDKEWNPLDLSKGYKRHEIIPNKPKEYDKMLLIAHKLSKGIPFLRVDLFENDKGEIKVGELTFVPSSGLIPFNPNKYDYIFGNELDISKFIKNNEL